MCGAYRLQTAVEAMRQLFPKDWKWNYPGILSPSKKGGPSSKKPDSQSVHRLIVRQKSEGAEFTSMRWRFESKWMRDKGVKVPINARSETMFSNGLFKFSARERRCLVVCDGFFEPKGPKGGKREQHLFTFPEQRPFALGGLSTSYKAEDDEFEGFVICTTTPNDQVEPIHNRMPIILENESAKNVNIASE